jgi:hypothetical protein
MYPNDNFKSFGY